MSIKEVYMCTSSGALQLVEMHPNSQKLKCTPNIFALFSPKNVMSALLVVSKKISPKLKLWSSLKMGVWQTVSPNKKPNVAMKQNNKKI